MKLYLVFCRVVSAIIAFACAAFALSPVAFAQTGATPPPPALTEAGPVETLSTTRAQICLNGLWRFEPAVGPGSKTPDPAGWGTIRVPGAWSVNNLYNIPGVTRKGAGAAWSGLTDSNRDAPWGQVSRGWYERTLSIPSDWAGRAILLDLSRVSTDAQITVNGVDCGRVGWPGGAVDISRAVTPGQTATLRVLVVSTDDKSVETVFMGVAQGQIETRQAKLEGRGIIGDVFLRGEPRGGKITDVFVQPSVRKHTLTLDVEISGVTEAGQVRLAPRALDETGHTAMNWPAQTVAVQPDKNGVATVRLVLPWASPRLWDMGRPNLYTLRLAATGAGVGDDYAQSFGFREFWIAGRHFYLNGSEVRLRPVQNGNGGFSGLSQIEVIDTMYDGFEKAGFNIQEMWPNDIYGRGIIEFLDLDYDRADRKGWAVIGALGSMAGLIDRWDEPHARDRWLEFTRQTLRRERNHPSVLMWIHSANRFGNWNDQDPRNVGNQARLAAVPDNQEKRTRVGLEADTLIKALDPTRPVTTHEGGPVGDIHTNNNYLNFLPFQEQEEWLSEWAQTGDRPYMPVEFGFLLGCDFKRGRLPGAWGRGQGATYTEHWTTERIAEFYGSEAYRQEPPDARAIHAKQFKAGATEDVLGKKLSPAFVDQYYGDRPGYIASDLTRAVMAQHYREVYRSWRTMGHTGGSTPWEYENGWERKYVREPAAPFVPGQRGMYNPTVEAYKLHWLQPAGSTRNAIGDALLASNGPTLAYICGAAIDGDNAAFTAKDHAFRAGQTAQKRIALLNDTRFTQPFTLSWRVTLGGKTLASGTVNNAPPLGIAETRFVPIDFTLPATLAAKTDGVIEMTAQFAWQTHRDTFAFRGFPTPAAPRQTTPVYFYDPKAKSAALLRTLGITPRPWKAGTAAPANALLVVGREALSDMSAPLAAIDAWAKKGGRVLILEQTPDWLRGRGFRVGQQLVRRVFAVDPSHPLLTGLDERDLRDWSGNSTLTDPRPVVTTKDRSPSSYPAYGWHWGNRGAVSSAIIEKPHRSGWRPLLEGDFDSAYSPLMEKDTGAGRITLCTLDLEDHAATDAGANLLARRLFAYVRTAPLANPAAHIWFMGSDADAARLQEMGAQIERTAQIPDAVAGTVVLVGAGGPSASDAGLLKYAGDGGLVVFLASAPLAGAGQESKGDFAGSLHVPAWPECRGLSASDLRYRAPHVASLLAADPATGRKVGADGLLARAAVGKGEMLWCRLDPDAFDADKLTYFRFTRWRQTRALSQVLANVGVPFAADDALLGSTHASLYHSDYRPAGTPQYATSDDPHRYYRW